MNAEDIESQLDRMERILGACPPSEMKASRVARSIVEIYLTRSASALLSHVRRLFPGEPETSWEPMQTENSNILRPPMPSVGAVRSAAPKLLAAVASQEGPRALEALDEMGVLGLCPPPDQQFRRLEFGVGTVIGRARLLPLVELAVFAAEGGDLARASAYLTEAHTLSPRSSDLHILHTVAGIISLGAGKLAEACGYLAESVRVCQRDGVACLRCRSRAPNLMLAERLLEHGEKAAVVEYLIQCQDVWRHFEGPIAAWVGAIQNDQETHLGLGTFADDPAIKIRVLLETNFLGQVPEATTKEIGRGPGPSLEDLRAKLDRENAEAVKGKLQTGRN